MTVKQVTEEIDEIIELVHHVGDAMGPRNADKMLERLARVQTYLKTQKGKPFYDLNNAPIIADVPGALKRRGLRPAGSTL